MHYVCCMPVDLIRQAADLSADWLTAVLRRSGVARDDAAVVNFEPSAIGTGQMSESYRVGLEWEGDASAGPDSVVVKVAASDETSRSTGFGVGVYEREIRFYREVAPRVGGAVAACHLAVYDSQEGWFTLVLEDATPAVQGDQIAGCTVEEASLALRELAGLQAPVWDDAALGAAAWLN